jgi:hypothetical protein
MMSNDSKSRVKRSLIDRWIFQFRHPLNHRFPHQKDREYVGERGPLH